MGDRPIIELGNKTPLQAANLPVLDRLATEGQCGIADPVKRGIAATTVLGTLAILGYNPLKHSIARGVIEAHGCGIGITSGDIAFRGNWATLDDSGKIVDRPTRILVKTSDQRKETSLALFLGKQEVQYRS